MSHSEGATLLRSAPLDDRRAVSQPNRTHMPPIISVANLSKRYASGFQALKNQAWSAHDQQVIKTGLEAFQRATAYQRN